MALNALHSFVLRDQPIHIPQQTQRYLDLIIKAKNLLLSMPLSDEDIHILDYLDNQDNPSVDALTVILKVCATEKLEDRHFKDLVKVAQLLVEVESFVRDYPNISIENKQFIWHLKKAKEYFYHGISISALELPIRAHNALERANHIYSIADLINYMQGDPAKLLKLTNIGIQAQEIILSRLNELYGLSFDTLEQEA